MKPYNPVYQHSYTVLIVSCESITVNSSIILSVGKEVNSNALVIYKSPALWPVPNGDA